MLETPSQGQCQGQCQVKQVNEKPADSGSSSSKSKENSEEVGVSETTNNNDESSSSSTSSSSASSSSEKNDNDNKVEDPATLYSTDDKLFSKETGSNVQVSLTPRQELNLSPTLLDQLSHHALNQSVYQIALLLDQLMVHLKDVGVQISEVQSFILRSVDPTVGLSNGLGLDRDRDINVVDQEKKTKRTSKRNSMGMGKKKDQKRMGSQNQNKLPVTTAWWWIIIEVLSHLQIPDTNKKRTAEHVKRRLSSLLHDAEELIRFISTIQENLEGGKKKFGRVIALSKTRLRSNVKNFFSSFVRKFDKNMMELF